ncbi:MAG: LruC domain-containing protein, partial [Gammaproteobacteria bacterium]|nr:LruC domain-containing protein [Gammaproteobacteria bacterium]
AATGASTEGEVEDHRFTISDPGVGYIYYPGENEFYTFAAEDTWPDTFDYDVNDVVMIYRNTLVVDSASTKVIRLDINGQLTAYGAGYHNGFAVHVPGLNKSDIDAQRTLLTKNAVPQIDSPLESAASEVVVIVSSDLRSESILGECLYHRVDPSCPNETSKFSFHAYLPLLTPSAQASIPTGAFDPFIFAADQHRGSIIGASPGRPLEIHTADFPPTSVGEAISSSYYSTEDDDSSDIEPTKYYKTQANMPWAIILPVQWDHPSEYIDISDAYPDFPAWVISGGATNEDWYLSVNADATKTWTVAD